MPIDALQQLVLELCAEWAARHPCLKAIYIFGSIGRGDYRCESDVDIAVDFVDLQGEMVADFNALHAEAEEFCAKLTKLTGHTAHFHRMLLGLPEDGAWPTIVETSEKPVARKGKAILVATPQAPIERRG